MILFLVTYLLLDCELLVAIVRRLTLWGEGFLVVCLGVNLGFEVSVGNLYIFEREV